jgi:hypothetical protein
MKYKQKKLGTRKTLFLGGRAPLFAGKGSFRGRAQSNGIGVTGKLVYGESANADFGAIHPLSIEDGPTAHWPRRRF